MNDTRIPLGLAGLVAYIVIYDVAATRLRRRKPHVRTISREVRDLQRSKGGRAVYHLAKTTLSRHLEPR